MKTATQLEQELKDRFFTNKYVKYQPMYNMQKSGDIFRDFYNFTKGQGGGKSADQEDYYYKDCIKKGINPFPEDPHTDGCFYHTSEDITWLLFKSVVGDYPKRFYKMSQPDRECVVSYMVIPAIITKLSAINYMLAYAMWATGNFQNELRYYAAWYKSTLVNDCLFQDAATMLDRLTDIRLYFITHDLPQHTTMPGWEAGVLNMWALLKQYC